MDLKMASSSPIDSQQSSIAQTDTNLKFPSEAKQHRLQHGNANADKWLKTWRATEDEEQKPAKPARTHWDMLLERRSTEELNEVLQNSSALLREGKLRLEGHLHARGNQLLIT